MERQQSLLLNGFYRNKSHRRTRHRFTNGLGIDGVGLPAFDVWFDILRWDQADNMAQRCELPSPMMRIATGLHTNETGFKLREER